MTEALGQFFSFVDALAAPASLHDVAGRFVHVNASAERATGLPVSRLLGRHVTDLVSAEDRAHVSAQFQRVLEHGVPIDFGMVFVDAAGTRRYTRAQHLPLCESGHVIGVLVLAWESRASEAVVEAHSLPAQLTPRQREVLDLIAGGWSTEAIAEQLKLTRPTVRNHIRDVLAQLDARSRLEAVARAQRAGLLAARPLETPHTPARG